MKNITKYLTWAGGFMPVALYMLIACNVAKAQTSSDSAATAGVKYNVLEVAMGKWANFCPDADQDVIEKVMPMYPRTYPLFWHSTDTMQVAGNPYASVYPMGYPQGSVDRAMLSGAVVQARPWEAKVGVRNAVAPKFDVKLVCTYNVATRLLTVTVKGTALTALTGDWRLNAYVLEDSISSGLSPLHNQVNAYNAAGSTSHATGSLSYYIGAGNPITSGSLYSHMHVARAILCPGASIWGEAAFLNPASGTSVSRTYTYTVPAGFVPKQMKVIGVVQKYGATTDDRDIENAIQVNVPVSALYFTGGRTQTLTLCQNSSASINSHTAASDEFVGHTVNWSLVSGPAHGSAVAAYTATSTGGTLTPTGLTYTPTAGYSGTDTFKVRVVDGALADTTTICVTVNPVPSSISGTLAICGTSTSALSSSPGGGTWSIAPTSIATVGAVTGIVSGVSVGTATVTYQLPTTCRAIAVVTVSTTPVAGSISGATTVCAGAGITLTGSVSGGSWSSSTTSVATVGVSSGVVTGVAAGTATISYTVTNSCGSASATYVITVNPLPVAGAITGGTSVCVASTITLSDAVSGGAWSVSNTNASITSAGVVTGVTAGTSIVSYTVTNGCGSTAATYAITVNPLPSAGAITGSTSVCEMAIMTLSNTVAGGIWGVSNTNAGITSSGIVTGIAAGTSTISYTVTNSCGSAVATYAITVNPLPSAGTITGGASVCVADNTTLSNAVSGGIWGVSNTNAGITSSGVVTGITAGISTISYTVTNGCGSASATYTITVNPLPSAGTITGSTSVCEMETITLSNAVTGGIWSASNSNAGVSSGVVTGIAAGTTIISYTIINSCGSATAVMPVTVLSAGVCHAGVAVNANLSAEVYPNPATDVLFITGQNVKRYSITSLTGSTLLEGHLRNGENAVAIRALPAGMYVVEVYTDKGDKILKKVVKD